MDISSEILFDEDELIRMHGNFFELQHDDLFLVDTTEELVQCTSGVLGSLQVELFRLVLLCLCHRLIQLTCFPGALKCLVIIMCGLYALCDFVKSDHLFNIILLYPITSLIYIVAAPLAKKGFIVTFSSCLLLIFLEFRYESSQTASIRGILMSIVMRLSSFAFDFENGTLPYTGTLSYIAYLYNPASIIFGPFCTFKEFVESFRRRSFWEELRSGGRAALCILFSICCVLLSSCSSVFSVPLLVKDYVTAFEFRTSHYFICFFSQALFWLTGGGGWIVKPLRVEVPRSVVDIVIAWNLPMHKYLKNYIYKPASKLGKSSIAIGFTFFVSSLLHGFNVKLSIVLLSLGYLTYVETCLRHELSNMFSACVQARECKDKCTHKRKSSHWLTFALNLIFILVAIYHLIYLGMLFDGLENQDDSFHQIYNKWETHSFASFKIALCTHVAYFLLNFIKCRNLMPIS